MWLNYIYKTDPTMGNIRILIFRFYVPHFALEESFGMDQVGRMNPYHPTENIFSLQTIMDYFNRHEPVTTL